MINHRIKKPGQLSNDGLERRLNVRLGELAFLQHFCRAEVNKLDKRKFSRRADHDVFELQDNNGEYNTDVAYRE